MKVSKPQQLLSYVFPITLKKVKEPGQKTIQLQMSKGEFQLAYGFVFYSDGKDYFPFRKSFKYLGEDLLQKQAILVLGSGIGSIGMILADLYPATTWKVKYVDIHPHILELCKEVMENYQTIDAQYHQNDAVQFIQKSDSFYDLICIDVFDEHIIPNQILTAAFFEMVKNRLTKNGVIILNAMFVSEHQEEGFNSIIEKLFKKKHLISTKKNIIYILYNTK